MNLNSNFLLITNLFCLLFRCIVFSAMFGKVGGTKSINRQRMKALIQRRKGQPKEYRRQGGETIGPVVPLTQGGSVEPYCSTCGGYFGHNTVDCTEFNVVDRLGYDSQADLANQEQGEVSDASSDWPPEVVPASVKETLNRGRERRAAISCTANRPGSSRDSAPKRHARKRLHSNTVAVKQR